jgi:hypothetical protein
VEIHRFDMGKRVCRCGKIRIDAPVLKLQGWRQFKRRPVVESPPSAFDPEEDPDPAPPESLESID